MRRLCVIAAVLAAPLAAHGEPCEAALSFAPGRSALSSETKHALAPMLEALRSHPELHARVSADGDGTLAKKRGDVVKWFLVDGGIEADRIETATGPASHVELVGCSGPVTQTVHPVVAQHLAPPDKSLVDDASDLAQLLAGGPDERHAHLDQALATARGPAITIGNDTVGFRGEDRSVGAHAGGGGLRLASATLVENIAPHREEATGRTYLTSEVAGGAVQGQGQKVKLDGRQLRALSRCYRKVSGLQPQDKDDVELTFAVDRAGRVTEPVVISDEDELVGCIGSVMTAWKFQALRGTKARIWLSVTLSAR